MIDVVADLHVHSRFSRAVSPQMNLSTISRFGRQKGIDILATGDWTHPMWMGEIHGQLEEKEEGLFILKKQTTENRQQETENRQQNKEVRFLLSTEVATIFSQNGKGRRIHQLLFVPSFAVAQKVNKELVKREQNLSSDGRPILGMSSKHLLQMLLEIDERILLIPAHVWTPWFGIYGQLSGFTSLDEAFEELSPFVYGIETGLSSDPEMNWQIKELETRSILSFSDAHSLMKMGREATIFQLESLSYENIRQAIMRPSVPNNKKQETDNRVLYTIEFYPEEGKYHYSGHRKCNIVMTPEEQQKVKGICPVCHRRLTDGVMRRVEELSSEEKRGVHAARGQNIIWIEDPHKNKPPFVKIVPLLEIIAEALGRPVTSPKVKVLFENLCRNNRSEFALLLQTPLPEIKKILLSLTTHNFANKITEGIEKVRQEQIVIQPGYDGVYGTVKIWPEGKDVAKDTDEENGQMELKL